LLLTPSIEVALRTGDERTSTAAGDGFGAAGGGVDTFGSGIGRSPRIFEAASVRTVQAATYAMQGAMGARAGAWADDAQIAHINVVKYFGEPPGLVVWIGRLG
jgi:hypothetical protein